jgi:amino acid transporter
MADSTDKRDETELERLDRNTIELVNELRVAGTGVQVLFAFLLIVPFNNRWSKVSSFDRYDYYLTLLCVAIATVLLIAPSIHHRLLFRRGDKEYIVALGTRFAIAAAAFLAVGLTGILVLISDFVFGSTAAVVVGACTAAVVGVLWFAVPLRHRWHDGAASPP